MSQETLDALYAQAANVRRQIAFERAVKKMNDAMAEVEAFGYTVRAEVRPVENIQKENTNE